MAAARLSMASGGQVQPVGTKGINAYLELPGTVQVEVMRVTSDASGDWVFSKFHKIKSVMIQNHGANIGTGVKDPPKVTITQGGSDTSGKLTIAHSTATEVFSIIIWGDY
jgi:hypothetical protein